MQANVLVLVSAMVLPSAPRDPSACPLHDQHMKELNARGAVAMGFDQEKTTHHFRLDRDGGRIEVEANDPADRGTKARVVAHLRRIRRQFAEGDFSAPLALSASTTARTTEAYRSMPRLPAATATRRPFQASPDSRAARRDRTSAGGSASAWPERRASTSIWGGRVIMRQGGTTAGREAQASRP